MKSLKNPVVSRFLSTLVFQIFAFYAFYSAYQSSNSAFCVGLVGLLMYLPTLILGLFWGAKSDRIHHTGRSYFFIQLAPVGLFALLGTLGQSDLALYASVLCISTIRSFRTPIYYSLLSILKEKHQTKTTKTVKLNTLAWQAPLFVAPLIVSLTNNSHVIVFGSLICIQALATLFSYPFYREINSSHNTKQNTGSIINEFKELKKSKHILTPLFIDAAIAMVMGLAASLPFLLEFHDLDGNNFGFLKTTFHLGGVAATVFMSSKLIKQIQLKHYGYMLFAWSLMTLGSLGANSYAFLGLWILLMGILDGISTLYREHIMLEFAKTHEMGKISSLNAWLISTGDELGEFNTGFIIQKANIFVFILISATVSLCSGAFAIFNKRTDFCTKAELKQGG